MKASLPTSPLDDLAEGRTQGRFTDETGGGVYARARKFLQDKQAEIANPPARKRAAPRRKAKGLSDEELAEAAGRGGSRGVMRAPSVDESMRAELNRAGVEEIPSYGRSKRAPTPDESMREELNRSGLAKGGTVKNYAKGGSIDGCAQRGKTKCRMV